MAVTLVSYGFNSTYAEVLAETLDSDKCKARKVGEYEAFSIASHLSSTIHDIDKWLSDFQIDIDNGRFQSNEDIQRHSMYWRHKALLSKALSMLVKSDTINPA